MDCQLCGGVIISLPVTSLKCRNPEVIDSSHNIGVYSPDHIGILTATIGKHVTLIYSVVDSTHDSRATGYRGQSFD